MSGQGYTKSIHNSHHFPEQNYRYMKWGTSVTPQHSNGSSYINYQPPYQQEYYNTERVADDSHIDYSTIAALDTGFKKLKSNQIEILKELRRQYQVLRNTQLEAGLAATKKHQTEFSESGDGSLSKMSKSRSDARSSSYSRVERTRRKSQHKESQIANLERKQMEVMLNNSMKKIQQLLSSQIELKKTVLELKAKLQNNETNEEQHNYLLKKHRDEVDSLKRALDDSKKENESLKHKIKDITNTVGTLQGDIAVSHLQLKKKEEKARALEEEVYHERNKFCNIQLDLKKSRMQCEMMERSYREQIAALQRRLNSSEEQQLYAKNDQIKRLTKELELKDQRYKLLLEHTNREKEEIKQKPKVQEDSKQDKDYVKSLEDKIQDLKHQLGQKSSQSEHVMNSIMSKMAEMASKPDQSLLDEVAALRKELQNAQFQSRDSLEGELKERIRDLQNNINELEKNIDEENTEKYYFVQDIKKIKAQMQKQKKAKEEAEAQAKELRYALRKVQEEARKYSYQIQALKHVNLDLEQSRLQNRSLMAKSQHFEQKEQQVVSLREDHSKFLEQHRSQINGYEEEIKTLKRKVAEGEVTAYKIKEQLELKMNLARTEHQAQMGRLLKELERIKKTHAMEMNERIGEKTQLEGKLMQKNRQLDRATNQLNSFVKERDSVFQSYRTQHENKIKALQDQSAAKVDHLAQKIQSLAELSNKHAEILHRNSILEQQSIEYKRILRHNRQVNDGIDHLWSVKEAQYSNLNQILKAIVE